MADGLGRASAERILSLVEGLLEKNSVRRTVAATDNLGEIGLTSIDMVSLMLAVEADFDVMIPQRDIAPENFRSAATIEALVARLTAARAAA